MSVSASEATFDLGDRCETLGCQNTVTDTETDDTYVNIDTGKRCSECVAATPPPSSDGGET
jgi:hypothetical protein